MKNNEAFHIPTGYFIEDGYVYQMDPKDSTRSTAIGFLDEFAEAAYIEGKPQLSRRVKSAQEGLDYIIRMTR